MGLLTIWEIGILDFNRYLPVQIGDLSKSELCQALEFFFLYNLQKTDL